MEPVTKGACQALTEKSRTDIGTTFRRGIADSVRSSLSMRVKRFFTIKSAVMRNRMASEKFHINPDRNFELIR